MSKNIHANVQTSFSPKVIEPHIDRTAYIHPMAAVIGSAYIGRRVMVSPGASVRSDEGQPIWVGDESNVQDGVVLHALETWENGAPVAHNLVEHDGRKFAVYVGNRVSLAHQCQIHGPAKVGDDSFIGMQTLVFKSEVGKGCVVEPKCLLLGVKVADGRYVPAGSVIKTQFDADQLPLIDENYAFKNLNKGVVHVNTHLADAYNEQMPAG
ncbi:MAG: carbonic anhydrase [Anaerolineae bacterium]|nr:carbonic anhydrase [Anaerolineae bacterium]